MLGHDQHTWIHIQWIHQCCPKTYYLAAECWRWTNPLNPLRKTPRVWFLHSTVCPMTATEEYTNSIFGPKHQTWDVSPLWGVSCLLNTSSPALNNGWVSMGQWKAHNRGALMCSLTWHYSQVAHQTSCFSVFFCDSESTTLLRALCATRCACSSPTRAGCSGHAHTRTGNLCSLDECENQQQGLNLTSQVF